MSMQNAEFILVLLFIIFHMNNYKLLPHILDEISSGEASQKRTLRGEKGLY